MMALTRVGMLVQVCAIEVGEAVLIGGEVAGDPVEDDAYASLVERIDQEHEVLRGAMAAGGCEETGDLIAP